MVLYNVPGRTVADMQTETVLRLAQVPGVIGIKEATGDIERGRWLIRDAPHGFSIYSGDDGTAVALMLLGGHGNVSVTANVAPRRDAGAVRRGARRQRPRGRRVCSCSCCRCTRRCSSSRARRRRNGRWRGSAAAAPASACRSLPLSAGGQAVVGRRCGEAGLREDARA